MYITPAFHQLEKNFQCNYIAIFVLLQIFDIHHLTLHGKIWHRNLATLDGI